VKELDAIASRLRGGTALAGVLDAGFDAFEVIRLVARASEDLAPELFAAFITAAGIAVEGRNALGGAPSLPAATGPPPAITMSATVGAGQIADELIAATRACSPGASATCWCWCCSNSVARMPTLTMLAVGNACRAW
jgi:hypothetical protein